MACLFVVLFMALLLPALWNDFPFVMDDSIGYSGQGIDWMRSKTAAVAMAPLYRQIGYWGLPLLNAALIAGAWLTLCHSFRLGRAAIFTIPLSILALQPIYASAVLVDAWFFGAIILAISAMVNSSLVLALLAGVALTAHGSGVLIFAALMTGVALIFRNARFVGMAGLTLATAVSVNFLLELNLGQDKPRLQSIFVASRAFSVHPELLTRECQRSGNTLLCEHAKLVEDLRRQPEHADRRDFFWEMAYRTAPAIELEQFEREHAPAIIRDAMSFRPWELAGSIAYDFASFYFPDTKFNFDAKLNETMPEAFAASRQAAGVMEAQATRNLATASRYLLYIVVIAAICIGWRKMTGDQKRWVFLLVAVCIVNDLFFAALSGPPDRYHHRILGLLAAAALISLAAIAQSKDARGE